MIQRPVTPPDVRSVFNPLSNMANGRSRISGQRRCGGIILVFSILAIGYIFFIVEWRTETLAMPSSAAPTETSVPAADAVSSTFPPGTQGNQAGATEVVAKASQGKELYPGLLTFQDFASYVVRASAVNEKCV